MRPTLVSTSVIVATALANVSLGAVRGTVEVAVEARSGEVESDWTAVYYGKPPLLIGNDGGAATGGFRTFTLDREKTLDQLAHKTPGRTKLVTTVYGIAGRDLVVTIAQTDSLFRIYNADDATLMGEPGTFTLGDWSALCPWRSPESGLQYLFLFGKGQAMQFLLREQASSLQLVEIQTFATPVEASACAVSLAEGSVYFSGDDSPDVYIFPTAESTIAQEIRVLGQAHDDVTGLAAYIGANSTDYLFVAHEDVVGVYDTSLELLGTVVLTGDEDIEVQGLGLFQGASDAYPAGALTFAIESDSSKGFGSSSLDMAFKNLGLTANTAFNPHKKPCKHTDPVCADCSFSGFCAGGLPGKRVTGCSCFPGFEGAACEFFVCDDSCAGHGECVGANQCSCEAGWGGLDCAFKVVEPVFETDANGGDGDDPAIWVSPGDPADSRIITTTKSEAGAGLGVFNLEGALLQTIVAGEPNNVDVIYGFEAGGRVVDLVFAACRADNTLCLFEMASNGTLGNIPGGTQHVKDDYEVYGSCVFRSRESGRQYLFVNSKAAEYLQYELTWDGGALETALVRNFTGGLGGQTEGCVADEANGWVLVGEEPYGLWRYGAEPEDDVSQGFLIGSVDDGMYADVEGVTLVEGATAGQGFILVSQQGVSAYNVYRRAPPHELVETFTIYENAVAGVDGVTNTDGIAAVSTGLGAKFPHGLLVVHDDANQLAEGGTSSEASFKLVSLGDILPGDLLDEIDPEWDPREHA